MLSILPILYPELILKRSFLKPVLDLNIVKLVQNKRTSMPAHRQREARSSFYPAPCKSV